MNLKASMLMFSLGVFYTIILFGLMSSFLPINITTSHSIEYLPTQMGEFWFREISPTHREYKFFKEALKQQHNINAEKFRVFEAGRGGGKDENMVQFAMQSARNNYLYFGIWDTRSVK